MAEQVQKSEKRGKGERALRFLRDFNLFVGGVALIGAVAIPAFAIPLKAYGGLNIAQAGGYEVWRRGVKKRQQTKTEKK